MGPVCQTVPQCVLVPGGSYCEQRGYTENFCQNVVTTERRSREVREFLHKTYADVEYDFYEVTRRGVDVDFSMKVILEEDQITHQAEDLAHQYVILSETRENSFSMGDDWKIEHKLLLNTVRQEDFFGIVSQIPELISSQNGIITFGVGSKHPEVTANIKLHLRTNNGQILTKELLPNEYYFLHQNDEEKTYLKINMQNILGPYWRYWRGQFVVGTLQLNITSNKQILNTHQFDSWGVIEQFNLRL